MYLMLGLLAAAYGIFILVAPFMIYGTSSGLGRLQTRIVRLEQAIMELQESHAKRTDGDAPDPPTVLNADLEPEVSAETIPEPVITQARERETTVAVADEPPNASMVESETVEVVQPGSESTPESRPETTRGQEPGVQPEPIEVTRNTAPVTSEPAEPPDFGSDEVNHSRQKAQHTDPWGLAKAWLLGGNTLARVGVVLLFFGVAFLLKYAIEVGVIPIEVRLAAVALGGFALLTLGWRLRAARRGYALILQGGGVGIVYLTCYSAVAFYDILPALPALGVMLLLVALAGALAVLQDARSLAVFGCVGGFLAPILMSQGQGSHVVLFSYYLILALGIFGIAWFKAWRDLNLIGFVFIFVLGGLWGYSFYQPAYYASTQFFLIAYFVLYALIPVLFALRQPPDLKGFVDASLVFGVPLVTLALQAALVRDFEYGLAFSAMGLGLFYAALALVLMVRHRRELRLLIETYLGLAVAFGTLAIPFAFDGRITGAAWALEGAALLWVGLRQNRIALRVAGLLLQVAAGLAYLVAMDAPVAATPVLNSVTLGGLMLAVAGLFSAWCLYRGRDALVPTERELHIPHAVLYWGLLWWFGTGISEISVHVPEPDRLPALLGFVALSAAGFWWLRRALAWHILRGPLFLLLPVMLLVAWLQFQAPVDHPFAGWGLAAWLLAFGVFYRVLRTLDQIPEEAAPDTGDTRTAHRAETLRVALQALHLGGFWLALVLVCWEAWWWIDRVTPEAPIWSETIWALLPMTVGFLLTRHGARLPWPVAGRDPLYRGVGLAPLMFMVALWCLYATFFAGHPAPLPYVPVLNPLELVQISGIAVLLYWSGRVPFHFDPQVRWSTLAVLAFLALNGVIARVAHFWAGVPFELQALWATDAYQASVSIVWTLAAMALMVLANRILRREVWVVGAVLIAAVVAKLFLVDLAGAGTLARIVSFLGVGSLLLLLGYLSPLPPRMSREAA